MIKRALLGLLLVGGACSEALLATDATDRFGVGGAGGWGELKARDDEQDATHGDLFGSGWIRIGLTPRNEFVLTYDSIQLKVKDDSEANRKRIRPVTVGVWTSLFPNRRWTPVATVGVGVASLHWMGSTETKSQSALAAQGGLGLEFFPVSSFSLGALIRLHYVVNDSGRSRTEATALTSGLMATLFWGGDDFPDPVSFTEIQKNPSPLLGPTDTDGDGVSDGSDACPGTPQGTSVDGVGCPPDTDKDGVLDVLDKCPGTPSGTMVDVEGCPVDKRSVTLDIKFAVGKADLDLKFEPSLAKVADFMKSFPETTVLIEGHTDSVGSAEFNRKLSQRRAEAVRRVLVRRYGVPAKRVTAKGFGAEKPILDNAAPEGRAANRRVVATISAVKK